MSVKLFGLILCFYIVASLLISSYDFESTSEAAGMDYSTGTATFTNGSTSVTGSGTSWDDSTMANGLIQLDADGIWCKISSVTNATTLVLSAAYTGDGGSGAYSMQASGAWGHSLSTEDEEANTDLEYVLNYKNATMQLPVMGGIPMPIPNPEYFKAWGRIITLTVPFLQQSGYMIVQYFLWAFAVMGILSLVLLVMGIITGNITWG
jgi:hypothetical protein